MFNKLFSKKPQVLQIACEYRAPHWLVLVKNIGQKHWEPVRSKTRKVTVQDEFGSIVKSYPAIQSFPSQEEAETWIRDNITVHERSHRKQSGTPLLTQDPTVSNHPYQYTKS